MELTGQQAEDVKQWQAEIGPTGKRSASIGKLTSKLAEACDAVKGVEKKGTNEKQRYKYVKAADIAKAIRHELFSRGIGVYPDEVEFKQIGSVKTLAGGELREFMLTVDYTLAYQEEWKVVRAFGIAMDSGDKAIWKAKTGALKYLLRTLGMIPDEKDDPEADEEVDALTSGDKRIQEYEQRFDQREAANGRIKQFQVNAFLTACAENGKTEKQIVSWLKTLSKVQAEELTPEEFQKGLKWAHGKEPIEETLKASVKAAKAKKESFNDSLANLSAEQTKITDQDISF